MVESDVAVLDGLPVTTPVRTIRDLLDRRIDASHIATIIRQAVDTGQVDWDDLVQQIGPFARNNGVQPGDGTELLRQLLAQDELAMHRFAMRTSELDALPPG
ncbi:hypothetical protein [Kibdelosporangium phytohabitans]|uniref:hypothetical protein n=1 Tax=Kibdelosporangium phytohabitans TaxID=860235 RepID=UPI0012F820C5|nr:hypothetical protein [Kibdelosporangium phytohabitans]MBE1464717.1 hypothetical protein [Kibdelosporangium phytohabitans]